VLAPYNLKITKKTYFAAEKDRSRRQPIPGQWTNLQARRA